MKIHDDNRECLYYMVSNNLQYSGYKHRESFGRNRSLHISKYGDVVLGIRIIGNNYGKMTIDLSNFREEINISGTDFHYFFKYQEFPLLALQYSQFTLSFDFDTEADIFYVLYDSEPRNKLARNGHILHSNEKLLLIESGVCWNITSLKDYIHHEEVEFTNILIKFGYQFCEKKDFVRLRQAIEGDLSLSAKIPNLPPILKMFGTGNLDLNEHYWDLDLLIRYNR